MKLINRQELPQYIPYDFYTDFLELLSKKRHGHMEKWEYDAAFGAKYWSQLIAAPGHYYLPLGDINNIQNALKTNELLNDISTCKNLIELGAGCITSMKGKTLPILQASSFQNYISVDATQSVAQASAKYIGQEHQINHSFTTCDFYQNDLSLNTKSNLFVYWGSSLGNFEGKIHKDPFAELVSFLSKMNRNMHSEDKILFSFDSCSDGQKVRQSYLEKNLSRQIVSIMQVATRDLPIEGSFDPRSWKHEPVWSDKYMQCAHYIAPTQKQEFSILGHDFKFEIGEALHSNNSYKYSCDKMSAALTMAGYQNIKFYKNHDMCLVYAHKS